MEHWVYSRRDEEAVLDEAELLRLIGALSHRHRLGLLARLHAGPGYISQLARELGVSRPLLHMHLEKLESAGLVTGHLELSPEGKALKIYELRPFDLTISADVITAAVQATRDAQAAAEPEPDAEPGATP